PGIDWRGHSALEAVTLYNGCWSYSPKAILIIAWGITPGLLATAICKRNILPGAMPLAMVTMAVG
ncbi:MAG: hypothetical protein ACKOOI_04200, partial [Pirellula sp.]